MATYTKNILLSLSYKKPHTILGSLSDPLGSDPIGCDSQSKADKSCLEVDRRRPHLLAFAGSPLSLELSFFDVFAVAVPEGDLVHASFVTLFLFPLTTAVA